jgi:hypothetical protein
LKFEHADGKFLLSSRAGLSRFIGAGFVVIGAVALLGYVLSGVSLIGLLLMLMWAVLFMGGGVAMLLQPDVTAEFDLRERSLNVFHRSVVGTMKVLRVPFDEVASLGLVRWYGGGDAVDTYAVELTLKNGSRVQLSSHFSDTLDEQIEAIRTAAGFERRDRPGRHFEVLERRPKLNWQRL